MLHCQILFDVVLFLILYMSAWINDKDGAEVRAGAGAGVRAWCSHIGPQIL